MVDIAAWPFGATARTTGDSVNMQFVGLKMGIVRNAGTVVGVGSLMVESSVASHSVPLKERARVELAAEEEAVEAAQLASVSQRAGRRSRSGSRSKSGRRSLYRSPVSRNRSASIGGGGSAAGRQITWADKVKGGPITGRTCEQSQEHVGCNRDKDRITQSEKENHSLKTSIGGLLKTVAELKRSLQTGNSTSEGRKPDSPAEVPRSVDVPKENVADEETPARKKEGALDCAGPGQGWF
ncbi:hypothetical protein MRX96_018655 [Rhipicephalus microplus]